MLLLGWETSYAAFTSAHWQSAILPNHTLQQGSTTFWTLLEFRHRVGSTATKWLLKELEPAIRRQPKCREDGLLGGNMLGKCSDREQTNTLVAAAIDSIMCTANEISRGQYEPGQDYPTPQFYPLSKHTWWVQERYRWFLWNPHTQCWRALNLKKSGIDETAVNYLCVEVKWQMYPFSN